MLNKIQGCLMGVAIGDALGAPFEIFTPEQILSATKGKGIVGFDHANEKKRRHTTTDDFQLTEAILSSIIRRKGFDLTDIALAHIEAADASTSGWGGTTQDSVIELDSYFSSLGREGRSPFVLPEVVPGRGMGNGVAMKIAPVAILEAIRHPLKNKIHNKMLLDYVYLAERVAGVGRLTHRHQRAWSAAYAVALIIVESLLFGQADWLSQPSDKRLFLDRLTKKVARFESKYLIRSGFAERLGRLQDSLLYGSIEDLRGVGTSCICLESVCFAIALFLRNTRDFKTGLLEAANSGGDVDTICAILGSMIGSVVGIEGIPQDWINFNPDFQKAIELSKSLTSLIL